MKPIKAWARPIKLQPNLFCAKTPNYKSKAHFVLKPQTIKPHRLASFAHFHLTLAHCYSMLSLSLSLSLKTQCYNKNRYPYLHRQTDTHICIFVLFLFKSRGNFQFVSAIDNFACLIISMPWSYFLGFPTIFFFSLLLPQPLATHKPSTTIATAPKTQATKQLKPPINPSTTTATAPKTHQPMPLI